MVDEVRIPHEYCCTTRAGRVTLPLRQRLTLGLRQRLTLGLRDNISSLKEVSFPLTIRFPGSQFVRSSRNRVDSRRVISSTFSCRNIHHSRYGLQSLQPLHLTAVTAYGRYSYTAYSRYSLQPLQLTAAAAVPGFTAVTNSYSFHGRI